MSHPAPAGVSHGPVASPGETNKGAEKMKITVERHDRKGQLETRSISRLKVGAVISALTEMAPTLRGPQRTACYRAIDSITAHRSRVDDPTRQVDLRWRDMAVLKSLLALATETVNSIAPHLNIR